MSTELMKAIEEARNALFEMYNAWENAGNVDELDKAYIERMPYLPSFDEFVWNFMEFTHDAVNIK